MRRHLFYLLLLIFAYPLQAVAATETAPITLRQFIEQVWQTSPKLQSVLAQTQAADFQAQGLSRPVYNPSLEADGSRTDTKNYSIGINQTLDVSGKREARTEVGKAGLMLSQLQAQQWRLHIGVATLKALADTEASQKVLTLTQQRTALLQKFVAEVKKQHQAGDVSRVQLDQGTLALAEARAKEAEAKTSYQQAQQALLALTGQTLSTWPSLPKTLPLPPTLKTYDHFAQQTPTLKLLNQQVEKARAAVAAAKAETHADPTVGVRGGREEDNKMVGLTVSIPLFARNNYQAGVGQAYQEMIALEKERQDVYQRLMAELPGSASRYDTLYQASHQWQTSAARTLKDGATLIHRLWAAHEITTTDYLVQLKQMTDTQIAGAELQGKAWDAWFVWLDTSGTLETWLKG